LKHAAERIDREMDQLNRDINTLTAEDRNKRKSALEKILVFVKSRSPDIPQSDLMHITKCVLRSLEDKAERCREIAVNILIDIVTSLSVEILDWMLPAVVARIGLEPVVEESEEIRLLLLDLALKCVDTFPHDIGPRNFLDFFRVLLENCLKDAFPDLKRRACEACRKLCAVEGKRMKSLAMPLAKVIKNFCLQHKHSVVRTDGVNAFADLLACGAADLLGDMRAEQDNRTTVYFLSILCCDHSESVRLATVSLLSRMLLDITERADQVRRLMPHVLVLLGDDHDRVRLASNTLLLNLGKMYMVDNEDNRIDFEHRRVTMKDIEWYADDDYPSLEFDDEPCTSVRFFQNRPSLGARYAVAEVVRNYLDKLLADITTLDWTIPFSTQNKRVVALRILQFTIFYCESNIVQFAQQVLGTLFKSIKDENEAVRDNSLLCVQLMGKFIKPEQYMPFIISKPDAAAREAATQASDDVNVMKSRTKTVTLVSVSTDVNLSQQPPTLFSTAPSSTKSSILIAFKHILLGSKHTLNPRQAEQVTKALVHPELLSLESPDLCASLLDCISSVIDVFAHRGFIPSPLSPLPAAVADDPHQRTLDSMLLYQILCMKSCDNNAIVSQASDVQRKLSIAVTGDSQGILSLHFGRLLLRHQSSMPVAAFNELVLGAPSVEKYAQELTSIFVSHLGNVNYTLRVTAELQFFTVLESLLSKRIADFSADSLEELLRAVVLNHGTFHPSPTANLFRKLAVNTLGTMLSEQGRSKLGQVLQRDNCALTERAVSVWLSAADSDDGEMRLSCVGMFPSLVRLTMSAGAASDMVHHILLRLDDSSDFIRLECAKSLNKFVNSDISEIFRFELLQKLSTIVKKLLVHLDDCDDRLGIRDELARVIKGLAVLNKAVVVELVQQARAKHFTTSFCDAIMTFVETL
jgi:dynein assembly factor 5